MNTHVPTLKGKDAKHFEQYVNRKVTEEEVKFMEKCDSVYLACCKDVKHTH